MKIDRKSFWLGVLLGVLGLLLINILQEVGILPARLVPVTEDLCPNDTQACVEAELHISSLPGQPRLYIKSLGFSDENSQFQGFASSDGSMWIAETMPGVSTEYVLTHESGHLVDFMALKGSPRAKSTPFSQYMITTTADDPSLSFYEISWSDSNTKKSGHDMYTAFVTPYAATAAVEDFAESYAWYKHKKEYFYQKALESPALMQKYSYMEILFENEFESAKKLLVAFGNMQKSAHAVAPQEVGHVSESSTQKASQQRVSTRVQTTKTLNWDNNSVQDLQSNEEVIQRQKPGAPFARLSATDVPVDTLYRAAVEILFNEGVVTGKGGQPGVFALSERVNRAEFVTLMGRLLTLPIPSTEADFRDVAGGEWYLDALKAASAAGLIRGYDDGTFRGERLVSAAEALKIALIGMNVISSGDPLWGQELITRAYQEGLLENLPPTDSNQVVDRGWVMQLLVNTNLLSTL